jgi:hypothetical protein
MNRAYQIIHYTLVLFVFSDFGRDGVPKGHDG